MTRYLVTGAGGMLGTDLRVALRKRDATYMTRQDLDITDASAVADAVRGHDVIINAAAYTKVDEAESHEDAAFAVNATGALNLATAAAARGATLVQLSTDYVFDGTAIEPYPEDTPRHPVSAYGRTKAEGERLSLQTNTRTYVVRTAWLYGEHGPNFVKTMLRLAADRDTVDVVTDQVGQPTWTRDLATRIVAMLDVNAPFGIYHGTNSGSASWFELAQATFEFAGFDPTRIKPTESAKFVRPAQRPKFSVLGHEAWQRTGLASMREWHEALRDAFRAGAMAA